jgi:hypothetical protein
VNTKLFRITGSDVFAAFQVFMAYYFTVPQVRRMFVSVQGVTINWLLCAAIFIGLCLYTSVGLYRKDASRSTLQALVIYANWAVLLIPLVTIAFLKCAWTRQDSLIFSLIMISAVAVVIWGKFNGHDLGHPIIRGMLVGLFRVVPHLFMAYCIFSVRSGHGIAVKTVMAANITALARIGTLYLSGRKSHWEKGVRALLLAESANEVSWMVTTLMWYIYL